MADRVECPICKTVLAEFDIRPGVRLKVTMPSNASPEMIENAGRALAEHFPDHPIFVHTDAMDVEPEGE